MTESHPGRSPLTRLVLFMACLAILASLVAGAHYYAVDLPQQQNVKAPANYCTYTYGQCFHGYYNYHDIDLCCYKDCCIGPMDLEDPR